MKARFPVAGLLQLVFPTAAHRHTSPSTALHPFYEITRRGTPELAEARRKLLDARGDKSTGWALAMAH